MEDSGVLQFLNAGFWNAAKTLRFLGPFPQPGNEFVNPAEHVIRGGRSGVRPRVHGSLPADLAWAGFPGSDVGRQVEGMASVVAFRRQVAVVGRGQVHPGGELFDDFNAEGGELGSLVRVVAEQADRGGAEGAKCFECSTWGARYR